MSSNSVVTVPREWMHSLVEGVDFGGKCWVLVRSPSAVLFWKYAHSGSVNGHRTYGRPGAYLLPDRVSAGNIKYRRVSPDGERLCYWTLAHIVHPAIEESFPDVGQDDLGRLLKLKQTILVEGGGPQPLPDWRLDPQAYDRWKMSTEQRGFWNRSAA